MTTDRDVTDALVTTLEDGRKGLESAAVRLRENGADALAVVFDELAARRRQMRDELAARANAHGDRIDESGSVLGTVHRGWMTVSDAISGSSIDGVLGAAHEGEQYTVNQFDAALTADISAELRSALLLQVAELRSTRDRLTELDPSA